MNGWKKYALSDFLTINPLISLKANQQYSFIEMKDLSDGQRFAYPSIERKLTGGARFEEGDTLFARITPCLENGKICQAKGLNNGIGFGSTEFLVLRGKKNISKNDFVFYLSRWEKVRRFAETNLVGTSGRQRVSKDVFEKLELELPDLSTQTRIASILSSLDDKIELNRRMNQTLEQMAQALFNHYFVDNIDPDNLPEGWRWGKLGELVSLTYGKALKEEQRKGGIFPVVGSSGIVGYHNESIGLKNGIVVGRKGNAGSVIWMHDAFFPIDTTFYISDLLKIEGFYFYYFLLKKLNLKSLNSDSAVPGLNKNEAHAQEIVIPERTKIAQFNNSAKVFFEKMKVNDTEIKTLTMIRDTLLPKLMSGEIDVDKK